MFSGRETKETTGNGSSMSNLLSDQKEKKKKKNFLNVPEGVSGISILRSTILGSCFGETSLTINELCLHARFMPGFLLSRESLPVEGLINIWGANQFFMRQKCCDSHILPLMFIVFHYPLRLKKNIFFMSQMVISPSTLETGSAPSVAVLFPWSQESICTHNSTGHTHCDPATRVQGKLGFQ